MNRLEISQQIQKKQSFLCVGLDTDLQKIPKHLLKEADPVFEFNKQIIDATSKYAVSYKINTAFYESRGIAGWESLEKTLEYIPKEIFTIADAKRGDIGNTAQHYAITFFETFPFDAVTLSPYMGSDSILPFLAYKNKWVILLGLTSNEGANDFEMLKCGDDYVYEKVIKTAVTWGNEDQMMFVVGATRAEALAEIRKVIPNHFLLIPGVGAQGGDLELTARLGLNADGGLLVNASRAIIYADNGVQFAEKAHESAAMMQREMQSLLQGVLTNS